MWAAVPPEQAAVAVCKACPVTVVVMQLNPQQLWGVEILLQFVQVVRDVVYMQVTTMQDTTFVMGTPTGGICFCAVACGGGCSTVPHGYFGCYGCCMSCYRCGTHPTTLTLV